MRLSLVLLAALGALVVAAAAAEAKVTGLDVTMEAPALVAPGEAANVTLVLMNAGDHELAITLDEGRRTDGLGALVVDATPFTLAPGETRRVGVVVPTREDTPAGTHGVYVVVARREPYEQWVPVRFAVAAVEPEHRLGLALQPSETMIVASIGGGEIQQTWRLVNPDDTRRWVNVTVSPLPEGWATAGFPEPIDIAPRSYVDLGAHFRAYVTAAPGTAQASLFATERPESSFAVFSMLTLVAVREPRPLVAAFSPDRLALGPGEEGTTTLLLRNDDITDREVAYAFDSTGDDALEVLTSAARVVVGAQRTLEVPVRVRLAEDADGFARLTVLYTEGGAERTLSMGIDVAPPGTVGVGVDGAPADRGGASPSTVLAIAAAGVGAGALGAVGVQRRFALALAALYARIAPSRVLEHATRRAIVERVRAEPGIAMADLQRALGLPNGPLAHHVRRLVSARVLSTSLDGKRRRLWPVEARQSDATLAQRALERIEARGSARLRELARELGTSPQALHYHLKRLHAEGRIVATLEGGRLTVRKAT